MQQLKNLKWFLNSASTLILIWWILSAKFDLLHFGVGVLGSLVIAANFYSSRGTTEFPLFRFIAFIPWHLTQVVLSNLRVARLALTPGTKFEPSFVHRAPNMTNTHGLALLGFGITLTPGTLTVDISPTHMLVHALDKASAEDIEGEIMARKVRRVFQEEVA